MKLFSLSFVFVMCFSAIGLDVSGQVNRKPLLQPIVIKPGETRPRTSPTPLVTKTSSTRPIISSGPAPDLVIMASRKTSFPVLANVTIPGTSGVLIESEDGMVVLDSFSNQAFNPASNVKVATAYAVLRTFGPEYRFSTGVWTDGTIDRSTRTLIGNVYVSGRDPIFNYEHAVAIADELNRIGITRIEGDLVVTSNFSMNFSTSSTRSASSLIRTMDVSTRNAAGRKAWNLYLSHSGNFATASPNPGVIFTGSSYVQSIPTNARLLFMHESAPLKEIVKATMSYSNNFLAERLGNMLGGAYGVERIVQRDAQVAPFEFNIETCSGLGINRVTPQAQVKLLRTFKDFLKKHKMSFRDVMPVAGLDDGTLKNRFDSAFQIGSVVGKTGTLRQTDNGVSTLSGEITTRKGTFFFVIFNQRGNVGAFRNFQDNFVPLVQGQLGGALSMQYLPIPMGRRLAKSRIVRPAGFAN